MNAKILKLIERAEAAIKTLSAQPGKGPIFIYIYNSKKYPDADDPELRKQIPDDAEVICLIPDNGRGDNSLPVIGGEESGQ